MALTTYTFEELPLIQSPDGYWAGLVDGVATIEFSRDATWRVDSITVKTCKSSLRDQFVTPPLPIRNIIELRLLADPQWHPKVQTAVDEALDRLLHPTREPDEIEVGPPTI